MAENNLHIESRFRNIEDTQRAFMWNLVIPGIKIVAPQSAKLNEEDLIIRCRSFAIPPRSTDVIESNFMGMKQFFPSKPNPGGTVVATFEETEDQRTTQILYEWQQMMFNVNPSNPVTAGKSKFPLKRLGTRDMFLTMFKYNGEPLSKSIRFVNGWIQNVGEVSMDYAAGANVVYSVTFQFDFWNLFPDTTV